MSLYNQLFGVNESAPVLLKMAGLTEGEIPRFRNVHAEDGKIIVRTRTGGGNREDYEDENTALTAKSNYLSDHDDDYDSTYAYFEFSPLDEYKDLLGALESKMPSVGDQFKDLIKKLQASA